MIESLLLGTNKKSVVPGSNYEDFLAVLTNNNVTLGTDTASPRQESKYFKHLIHADAGRTMWGSPYMQYLYLYSEFPRIARHCFPDLGTYNYNSDNALYCAFKFSYFGSMNSFSALTRNGYTSLSQTRGGGSKITDFIYYDSSLGKVMRYSPVDGLIVSPPVVFNGLLK